MITEPKRKSHRGDYNRDECERRHREKMLDDALKNTFPASDPISIVLPTPPAAARRRPRQSRDLKLGCIAVANTVLS